MSLKCLHVHNTHTIHQRCRLSDIEAPRLSKRRSVRDSSHTMAPVGRRNSVKENSRTLSRVIKNQDDLLAFYDREVRELQDEAGDNDHAPIAGNLYRYLALKSFGESSGLYQFHTSGSDWRVMLGLFLIVFVQICAPLMVLSWGYYHLDYAEEPKLPFCLACQWRFEKGFGNFCKRILGVVFIFLFCANGVYVMSSERLNMRKTLDMVAIFDAAAARSADLIEDGESDREAYPPTNHFWLWLDPMVNIWCCSICALCLLPLFTIAEDGPKDIVYDAFALLFLSNLDDVTGDLAFLQERWDAGQFGDIFGKLSDAVSQGSPHEGSLLDDIREERDSRLTPDNLYEFGIALLTALMFILPLCWIFSNGTRRHLVEDELGMEEKQISNVTAAVEMLVATVHMLQGQVDDLSGRLKAKDSWP